jgi:hypothetical protein
MGDKKKPYVSPQTPFESVQETVETPDIQAFRAFSPDTKMLSSTVGKRFDDRRRQIRDDYGAYSGIPSQVARNAMRDEALADVDEAEGLALAEGDERTKALEMEKLATLAPLTRKTKSSGFNTQIIQPQQQPGFLSSFGQGFGAGLGGALPFI